MGWFHRLADLKPEEVGVVARSFACFFCLLAGYYLLRPLRDEMGIRAGVDQLQWLFSATFVVMLVAVPIYGALVRKFPRRTLIKLVYRFFVVNLVVFWGVFRLELAPVWTARVFFVWVSVFNLFLVSLFWSAMADLFSPGRGRRVFGTIAAGGTAGGLAGPAVAGGLALVLQPVDLLLVAGALLEAATRLGAGVARPDRVGGGAGQVPTGGSIWAGARHVFTSPYLLGIAVYMLLMTTAATFLYFEQQHLVAREVEDTGARTGLFAGLDLIVNLLTLVVQLLLTGRLLRLLGVALVLGIVPLLTAVGFTLLAWMPAVAMILGIQAVRRAANYSLAKPARELLYTVVSQEDKYKAKGFLDTVVYRGGDAAAGWAFTGLSAIGLGLAGIAGVGIPLSLGWAVVAWMLGRSQQRRASESEAATLQAS